MFDTARKTPVVFFLKGQKSLITVALRVVSVKIRDFQYLKVFPENQGFTFFSESKNTVRDDPDLSHFLQSFLVARHSP